MTRWTGFMGAAALVAVAAGCPATGTLDHTFDEANLSSVPDERMEEVFEARRDVDRASIELERAEAAVRRAELEVERAENLVERGELAVDYAESNLETARESLDPQQIEEARMPVIEAQQELRVAEARLAYAESLTEMREAERDYRDAVHVAEQARAELTEAQVADQEGLRAPGPTLSEFEQQHRERVLDARRALGEVEQAREVADARRSAWQRVAEAQEEEAE
jgi:predicted  nucleic acid-binding Zn-ribbon protein